MLEDGGPARKGSDDVHQKLGVKPTKKTYRKTGISPIDLRSSALPEF